MAAVAGDTDDKAHLNNITARNYRQLLRTHYDVYAVPGKPAF